MPGPSDPRPANDYARSASPDDPVQELYNRVRNIEGSDAADAMLRKIYAPSGFAQSDPINGIPRDVSALPAVPAATTPSSVPQTSSSPSPDVTGAIHSMIAALAQAFAPRAVVQRPQAIEQAVNGATGAPQPGLGHEF